MAIDRYCSLLQAIDSEMSNSTGSIGGSYDAPTRMYSPRHIGSPVDSGSVLYFGSKVARTAGLTSLVEKLGGAKRLANSHLVTTKLSKYIRQQQKLLKLKEELIQELRRWSDLVPDDDSKTIISQLAACFNVERELEEDQLHKQELLRIELTNVTKRESKLQDLRVKRNKIYKELRINESKYGETQSTVLVREHLEGLNVCLEVVAEQYINSITRNLKSTVAQFMMTISLNAALLKANIDQYFAELASIPGNIDSSRKSAYSGSKTESPVQNQSVQNQPVQPLRKLLNHNSYNQADKNTLSSSTVQVPLKTTSANYIEILRNQLMEKYQGSDNSHGASQLVEENSRLQFCELCKSARTNSCNHAHTLTSSNKQARSMKGGTYVSDNPFNKQRSKMPRGPEFRAATDFQAEGYSGM